MSQLYIIALISGAISVLTYLGGILVAIQKRNTSNRAANYVMLALGILLLWFFLRALGFPVLSNYFSPATFGSVAVFLQLVNALVMAIAIGLFLAAAFVDRHHSTSDVEQFLPGQKRETLRDGNPYSATSVRDN